MPKVEATPNPELPKSKAVIPQVKPALPSPVPVVKPSPAIAPTPSIKSVPKPPLPIIQQPQPSITSKLVTPIAKPEAPQRVAPKPTPVPAKVPDAISPDKSATVKTVKPAPAQTKTKDDELGIEQLNNKLKGFLGQFRSNDTGTAVKSPIVKPPAPALVSPTPAVKVPTNKLPTDQVTPLKTAIDKIDKAASDKAAAAKTAIDKAVPDKGVINKTAVEKAVTDKLSAVKTAIDKAPTAKVIPDKISRMSPSFKALPEKAPEKAVIPAAPVMPKASPSPSLTDDLSKKVVDQAESAKSGLSDKLETTEKAFNNFLKQFEKTESKSANEPKPTVSPAAVAPMMPKAKIIPQPQPSTTEPPRKSIAELLKKSTAPEKLVKQPIPVPATPKLPKPTPAATVAPKVMVTPTPVPTPPISINQQQGAAPRPQPSASLEIIKPQPMPKIPSRYLDKAPEVNKPESLKET
jgi:hypothetical protein